MNSKKVLFLVIVLLIFIFSLYAKAPVTTKLTKIDTQPKVLKSIKPKYPEELKKKGIEGTVMLDVAVDKSGNVCNVKVAKSVNSQLDKEALNAVKQWKFKPALSKGKPVKTTVKIPVAFRLCDVLDIGCDFNSEKKEPPIAIKMVAPKYPENVKKLGIEGTVILNAIIDKNGNVGKVEVKKSLYPALDNEAVKALKQWKFTPAKNDNKPISVWITMPFEFSLHKQQQ